MVLSAFKIGTFPLTSTGLKILTFVKMFQGLPTVLAQVKAGNTSERLLNEINQVIYSSYRTKEITKKVYNNKMNSIQIYRYNQKNNKTSAPRRLLLNLSDKRNLKRNNKYFASPNLRIYYT